MISVVAVVKVLHVQLYGGGGEGEAAAEEKRESDLEVTWCSW